MVIGAWGEDRFNVLAALPFLSHSGDISALLPAPAPPSSPHQQRRPKKRLIGPAIRLAWIGARPGLRSSPAQIRSNPNGSLDWPVEAATEYASCSCTPVSPHCR